MAQTPIPSTTTARPAAVPPGDPELAAQLAQALDGEVLFDAFSRGRYSTDASIYQIEPVGVVVPKSEADLSRALEIAHAHGVSLLPRGAGTSQCGQTVGRSLVIDFSRHLDGLIDLDLETATAVVQPGVVLDRLNAALRPHGLWFPVDVSTSSRATLGGMAGNNSSGARSIRYGQMRDNVLAIDALLADGSEIHFEALDDALMRDNRPSSERDLVRRLLGIARREAAEIEARFPKVPRRVGGYNLDALLPAKPPGSGDHRPPGAPANLAHLLVGSEGTLALFRRLHLKLSPLPVHRVLGVCHFDSFRAAMSATPTLVALGPSAVELVGREMIDLARKIPLFRDAIPRFVKGEPEALLLVEFAGDDQEATLQGLANLRDAMADLGQADGLVEAREPDLQRLIWEVRKQALNIAMSMKGDGKPVSFVEDCAVPLEHLADYSTRLDAIFKKHGTRGTWYAHASVGTLHVRPILNLKLESDARAMQAIAEDCFAMVREYKGAHSGEHGDGLVRSAFHEAMFGRRLTDAFTEIKASFDPEGLMNPGKIVDPPAMNDRRLFRYPPGYATDPEAGTLDWSAWGGFGGAVEMCNNNGACRKFEAGVMCPPFRVTRDEQHLVRGRANSLRLALSGQLGADALASDAMAETMTLCVSCKACKRECPTGVDMARMKVEVLHARANRHGVSRRDRLIANLPRIAPYLSWFPPLGNARDRVPGLARVSEMLFGLSAKRRLPRWASSAFDPGFKMERRGKEPEVLLWVDTFSRYFDSDVAWSAFNLLMQGGYHVHLPKPSDHRRPLCCGRTYLAAGLVEEARAELIRTRSVLRPFVERDVPIVGLEPSCLFTLVDELPALLPDDESQALAAQARFIDVFLAEEAEAGRLSLPLHPLRARRALLHGHCHQKAFQSFEASRKVLSLVPGLEVETIESSCCGMAGAFGYQAETYETSMQMAELSLLPAVREAPEDSLIVADGTSCRQQIAHGSGRHARHVVQVLADAMPNRGSL